MPIDQLPTRRAISPGDAKLVQFDRYIDAQIQSTRRLVKVVDLASATVALAAGALLFLLTAAIVEHWLVPGGFSAAVRTLLFVLLVGGAGYFAYRRLWPLLVRAINPVYAARTIEQSNPTLKNTLINLLLFRQRRGEVSDAVYQTLEEQAARRLTRAPVDAAVDRSQLIRLGYVLVAVLAVAALYKIVSPKDPLTTAERVLMPWADIVPASRVQISAVEPGSVTLARGEFLDISASVRGIGEDDPVVLRFTTADGQAVNKPLPMTSTRDGFRFEGRLPAAGDGGAGMLGLAQNLTYRIEAGDARSLDYAVTVVPAPALLVQRIDYDYPDYTGEPDRTVEAGAGRAVPNLGHIRAIEGTRVTLHARANGPIDEAFIDFDADGRRDLPMSRDGTVANASFVLALRDDRQTPKHASYVLRFRNTDGRENHNPVKYPIEVLRDYDPEVTLIAPRERIRDVRLDETVMIEVDAHDPDFALSEVRLRGESIGRPKIDVSLLANKHVGRFTGRYSFKPSEHSLRAGDVVQYWVTANDNRTPTANTAASERQTFRILSPDPDKQPPPDRIARNDPPRGQQGGEPQSGQSGGESQPGQPGGEPQPGQPGGEPQPGQAGGEAGGDGTQKPFSRDAERSANDEQSQGGGEAQPDGTQPQPGQQDQNSEQTGAGAAGGDAANQAAQPDGARPEQGDSTPPTGDNVAQRTGDNGSRSADGNQAQRPGDGQSDESEPSPVSSEGDNDAEAIRRIREHLRRNNQLNDEENGAETPDAETPDSKAPSGDPGASDGQAKPPGEKPTSSDDPSGNVDPSGQNQRVRTAPPGTKPDQRWDQAPTPERSDDEPNTGSPGRSRPDSAGDEGGELPDDSQDAADKPVERDGAGNTGQSQSAERGAGESGERGAGNDSSDSGRDVTADEPTGQPSDGTPGRGSTRREGEGNRAGGSGADENTARGATDADSEPLSRNAEGERGAGDSDSANEPQDPTGRGARPGTRDESASDRPDSSDGDTGESASEGSAAGERGAPPRGNDPTATERNRAGAATGDGGQTGTSADTPPPAEGTAPEGDAANLEYARKQTDLVLEKLSEQLARKQLDDDLLKNLGWSEEDLRKFVARWQERKEAAQRSDTAADAARRELDDALRSLGLRRSGPLRQNEANDDELRDLRRGYRGQVPLELKERLEAYNRGVSRAERDGG